MAQNVLFSTVVILSLASISAHAFGAGGNVELLNERFSCSKLAINNDWETSSTEGAILVVPENLEFFSMDVKYEGYPETFTANKDGECFVVPQCKPIENIKIVGYDVSVYVFSEKADDNGGIGECLGFDFNRLERCTIVGPDMAYSISKLECPDTGDDENVGNVAKVENEAGGATELEKLTKEVEKMKEELAEKDHVIEVFIEKARSAQKRIAVIYFVLGVVFSVTIMLFVKVHKMEKRQRESRNRKRRDYTFDF